MMLTLSIEIDVEIRFRFLTGFHYKFDVSKSTVRIDFRNVNHVSREVTFSIEKRS